MNRRALPLALPLALLSLTLAPVATPATAASGAVAFIDVNVLPMNVPGVLAAQTVVVRDGRIVAIGAAGQVEVPADAVRIDGAGKFLMPGLAEMHGHYAQDAESQFSRDVLFLYVANGVTFVRGMQGGPQHLPLRDAIERGEVLGPRLAVSAPAMYGGGQNPLTDPALAVERVRQAKADGFDHLKVHEGLSREVYAAIAATANELELPFAGHVTNHVGLLDALEQGQQTIDHLDNFLEALVPDQAAVAELGLFEQGQIVAQIDTARIDEVVAATRASGAGVVPTEYLWETFLGWRGGDEMIAAHPEVRYMPAAMVDNWRGNVDQGLASRAEAPRAAEPIIQLRRRIMRALYEAGVPVLLGTDSPQVFSVPGFSIHHEMRVMVESGFTPYEVLYTGTRAVAQFYGQDDDHGSVAAGQRADLVLLNADPTVDVAAFADRAGVMVNGRWLSEPDIQTELAAIAARIAAAQ